MRFILLISALVSNVSFAQVEMSCSDVIAYEYITGLQIVEAHDLCQFTESSKTAEEIRLCIDECFAVFDRPSAEFKACVSKCKE